jgi:hypothetical protein
VKRGIGAVLIACVGVHAQVMLGVTGATAPSAPTLFNDGRWRGIAAGIEARMELPAASALFDLPLHLAVGAEMLRPTLSQVELPGDYRGWIGRLSLVWQASRTSSLRPMLRLGGGISVGQQYTQVPRWDTSAPPQWHWGRSFVAFWALGVEGTMRAELDWHAEIECLTGDQIGLVLPLRVGLFYRWGNRQ